MGAIHIIFLLNNLLTVELHHSKHAEPIRIVYGFCAG